MSSATAEQITALEQKITAAETKAQTSTEADRARLEQLRRQAVTEAEQENARRAARRQSWARHYLAAEHSAEVAEARKAVTQARREFETVLAEQPWVKALLDWQGALNAQNAAERRAGYARTLLGQSDTSSPGAPNVLPMIDSEVSFTPLGRLLHHFAASLERVDPAAEVDALAGHADGKGDPLGDALAMQPVGKDDPLVYLARNGARLDVVRHSTEDGTVVVHRNPVSDEWVTTDDAGNVTGASWTTAKTKGEPSNPIDGRQFGSVLDPEQGKFVKVRTR